MCYSHQDVGYLARLDAHLRASGINVWYDRHLHHRSRWRNEIERRIVEAAAVVVVMTPAAQASREVQGELGLALDRGKPVLGLLLAGEVWYQLRPLQFEDVTGSRMPSTAFVDRLRHHAGLAGRPTAQHPTRVPPTPQPAPSRENLRILGGIVAGALLVTFSCSVGFTILVDGLIRQKHREPRPGVVGTGTPSPGATGITPTPPPRARRRGSRGRRP